MYYNTPDIEKYIDKLIEFRKPIILFYFLLTATLAFISQPKFLSSDALFWLNDSQEFQKTQEQNFQAYKLSKLTVNIETLDDIKLKELQKLHKQLLHLKGVLKVSSIFSNDYIQTKKEHDSEMVVVINNSKLDTLKIKKLVQETHNNYCNMVDNDFKTFYFFISSTQKIEINSIKIPGKFHYTSMEKEATPQLIFFYLILFITLLFTIFRLLFRNFISAFAALLVIGFTTILTFSTIALLTHISTMHIAMPLITLSISLVEFLYFYHRWHILQHKKNVFKILSKMLNRNMIPAMWTSILTLFGLGTLLFVDSDIIKLLSLSVIFSSMIAYILNLTLLPAFLSFFKLRHTHMSYTKLEYILASNELHYNRKYLFVFLSLTYSLLFIGGYLLYSKDSTLFQLPVKNEQIELKIPYKEIDIKLIHSLEKFSNKLQERFEDELGEINSLATIVNSLNEANSQTDELDDESLLQALFYLDLYNLSDKYFDENSLFFQINLFDVNKLELLEWLTNYKEIELYFVDKESLLSISKYNQTLLLASSLFFALLFIALITGWIFRSKAMIFVSFSINAIPIVWFGVVSAIVNIPLTLEMIIAMTISLGLASDATIHFTFKYFRLRYFGRSKKHSLEKLFFYAGVPVIIGSLILMLIFASLYFSRIHSLELIGAYSASLIFISLLSDLFILPVMLLFIDRNRFKIYLQD